jgi:RimJ/RimL family protein N-acetyltransferase
MDKLRQPLRHERPRYNPVMSANPATLRWTTTDGTALQLRPVHADDTQRLQRSLSLVSREARRQRFLGTVSAFSDDFVNGLTAGDPVQQYAVLAVRDEGGEEMPVAGGRLVIDPPDKPGDACEFSLIVGDRWQGQGVGQRILYALIAEARHRRRQTMVGHILRDNRPMLVLARHTGFIIEAEPGGDTLRATLDLNALVVTQALADRGFSAVPVAKSRTQRAASAGQPGAEAAPLRAALLCAALAIAGLLLAMASVYLGTD